jgi:hypothetical protein
MLGVWDFRELDCFNVALLAKQCWRLLKFPDSLLARVMRAKSYPGADFMGSDLGKRPSFAWRSIWHARSLLEEGLLWRVGNGEKIKIWEDRWIPTSSTHKIQDLVRLLSREAKVAEIINGNTNWWNIPLKEQIFPHETVEKICSLPVCPRSQEDRLVWARTKLGTFSVHSAYHLEMERRSRVVGCSFMTSSSSPFWQRL